MHREYNHLAAGITWLLYIIYAHDRSAFCASFEINNKTRVKKSVF